MKDYDYVINHDYDADDSGLSAEEYNLLSEPNRRLYDKLQGEANNRRMARLDQVEENNRRMAIIVRIEDENEVRLDQAIQEGGTNQEIRERVLRVEEQNQKRMEKAMRAFDNNPR
jgi:hypothetical protein